MTTDNIAQLSAGAAKLLLVLLLGGAELPAEEQRSRAGIDSRRAYFRAKAQLRETGLLECHLLAPPVPPSGTPECHPAALVPPTGTRLVPPTGTGATERHSPVPPTGTPARVPDGDDFLDGITGSWLAQCAQADRMPADGDATQRGSNYQARRQAQIVALRGAYLDFFGQELHPSAAKDMLRLAHDSAEAVFEAMEKASARKPEHPNSYIQGILRREAAAAPAPVPVAPADPEELRPWTQEDHDFGVKMARLLAAKGWDMTGVIPGE